MKIASLKHITWQLSEVSSPLIDHPVTVVAAKDIPYIDNANRFQNLSIYLPETRENSKLIGTAVESLPGTDIQPGLPRFYVHIHGGAWRDPQLTSTSIEPTVACAFDPSDGLVPILAIASINYSTTKFPTHPNLPYDPIKDNHSDISREAVHPQHVSDILHGLKLLCSLGLTDESYILSGHSCGAFIAFQSILQSPAFYGLDYLPDAPGPAAMLGLNGLYDLPNLVDGLGAAHQHLRSDYEMMISNAIGPDKSNWPSVSPSHFDTEVIVKRVAAKKAPRFVILDHSAEDQLVPMNQQDLLKANLTKVNGLCVVEGNRNSGQHAAPWEQGGMIWQNIKDCLELLEENFTSQ